MKYVLFEETEGPVYTIFKNEVLKIRRFSPAWSEVASFIIPGLGQMMCEETGRGFAYPGGTVGCYIITGLGASIAAGSFTTYQDQYGDIAIEENLSGAVVGLLQDASRQQELLLP